MIQKRYIEGLDFYRLAEFYKDDKNHLKCKVTPNEEQRMDGDSRHYIYAHYVNDELVYIGADRGSTVLIGIKLSRDQCNQCIGILHFWAEHRCLLVDYFTVSKTLV